MAADKLQLQVILSALDKATAPLKRIQGGSIGAARALKETRDKIKQLNDIQRNITGFKAYQTQLEGTSNALQQARDKMGAIERALESHRTVQQALAGETKVHRAAVRNLQSELLRSQKPNAELSKQYMLAKDHLAKLESKYNASQNTMRRYKQNLDATGHAARALNSKHQALSQNLTDARTKLDAAGVSTDKLAQHERDLAGGLDKANAALKVQKDRLAAITKQQSSLHRARANYSKTQQLAGSMAAGGAAGLASGYAIARPLKGVIDAFAPAENATTQLKVSMMGSDGTVAADFQKISDLANNLGDRLPGTTADFNEMMTMLKRQGLSSANILGGTGEAAAYLAVQLQMPVTAAAEFAAKMQDATRTSEKDMLGLMDTIQRTYYLGVDSGNMLQGFSKISPVMGIIKQQGLEAANTLTPLLVMMDQTGMAGESAGNALRKVFQSGLNVGKVAKANKELKTLGIRMDFTDGKGEFGGMDKLFAQLEKLKGLSAVKRTSVMKTIFGDDAETLTTVETMMNKGMAGYEEIAAKMQAQADLRKRVNEQLGTLSNTMEAAQGSWSNTMAEVGVAIAPELKEFIKSLGEIAIKVKGWVKENPQLTAQIVKTAAGLAILLAACGGLSLMIASIAGPVAIVRLSMALLGIKSRGLISPLQGLGAATEGTASKAGALSKAWGGLAKAGTWLGQGLRSMLPTITGLAKNALPMLAAGLRTVGVALLTTPLGWFLLAIAAIAGAAYLIYKNWEPIKGFFLGLWSDIKAGFDGGLIGIAGLILNFSPLGLFYRAFAGVMGYFGIELPGKFTEFGGMLMTGLVNGITNAMGDVKTAITGAGDSTIGWFKEKLGIHSPSRVFASLGGFTMAGLAQGLAGGEGDVLNQVASTAKRVAHAGVIAIGVTAGSSPAMAALPQQQPQALQQQVVQVLTNVNTSELPELLQRVRVLVDMPPALAKLTTETPITVDSRPPISAAGGGITVQGDTYSITIQATPGTDSAGLRQMLNQLLDERERNKAARMRSRLSDQE